MPKEAGIAIQHHYEPYDVGKHSAYLTLVFMVLRLLRQYEIGESAEEEIPEFPYDRFELDPEEVERVVEKVLVSNDDIIAKAIAFPSYAAR